MQDGQGRYAVLEKRSIVPADAPALHALQAYGFAARHTYMDGPASHGSWFIRWMGLADRIFYRHPRSLAIDLLLHFRFP